MVILGYICISIDTGFTDFFRRNKLFLFLTFYLNRNKKKTVADRLSSMAAVTLLSPPII